MLRKALVSKRSICNKKGLTFKGAAIVVLGIHILGLFSLFGYSKYKSNQAKIAREEWRTKLEQRQGNEWVDNNSDNPNAKLRVVARPSKQICSNASKKASSDTSSKTPKTANALDLVAKINNVTEVAGNKLDALVNEINGSSKMFGTHTANKKNSAQQIVVNKPTKQKHSHSTPTASSTEQTRYERLAKALEYDKKKKAYIASQKMHADIPKISSEPIRTQVPKLVAKVDRQMNAITRPIDDKLRRDIEFDEVTREVVHTFYSY